MIKIYMGFARFKKQLLCYKNLKAMIDFLMNSFFLFVPLWRFLLIKNIYCYTFNKTITENNINREVGKLIKNI